MAPRVGEAPLSFLNLCRPTSERNFAAGPEPAPAGAAKSRQAGHCRLRSTQFRSSRPTHDGIQVRVYCIRCVRSRCRESSLPGSESKQEAAPAVARPGCNQLGEAMVVHSLLPDRPGRTASSTPGGGEG